MNTKDNWKVYKHTNLTNGKVYIGITKNRPEQRWHRGSNYPGNRYFTDSIKKYGWEGFSHEVLYEGLTEKEASELERKLIAEYDSTNREKGYNIALGGYGRESISDETREKLRKAQLGEKNHNYGKPKSEEVKRKLSESNKRYWTEHPRPKGIPRSEETKRKMSESNKGRKGTMTGKHHKQESIEMIRAKNSKPVICVETGEIFPSARAVAEKYGGTYTTISQVCNHHPKHKTAYGYHWEFVNKEEIA